MAERHDLAGDGNVTLWRLQQLEEEIKELVRAFQGATSALGAQITALSTQIGTGLANLPATYAPRMEAEERHKAINERFVALEKRQMDYDRALNERFAALDARLGERRTNTEEHFKEILKRTERLERGAWGIAVGIIAALAGAFFAVFKVTVGG